MSIPIDTCPLNTMRCAAERAAGGALGVGLMWPTCPYYCSRSYFRSCFRPFSAGKEYVVESVCVAIM